MKNYIKEITKDLEPGWIDKVIKIRDETIEHGKKHPNFKKVGKSASWASLEDCLMVYAMVRYYKPKTIVEIGTYIGTITRVMSIAMAHNKSKKPGAILTCDKNNVYAPIGGDKFRVFYSNEMSTSFLKKVKKGTIDFCFIDGGFKDKDNKRLKKLYKNKVVFATHDYKPDQKGIRNIKAMKKVTKDPVVYKPTEQGIGYDVGLDYNINSSVGVLIA